MFEDTKGVIRIIYIVKTTDNTMVKSKKSLKIPKGGNQNSYIEKEQTTQ
jgi:hypothetical protein